MPTQTTYGYQAVAASPGQLVCRPEEAEIDQFFNDEASAEIAFGRAVMFGSATVATSAKLPTAETSKIIGIVLASYAMENGTHGELGTTGYIVGAPMSVLRKGVVWVTVEDAVVPGDRLWVRGVAAGDPEFLGGLLPADDGTDTVDCTAAGEFQTAAAAGALAQLRVDFV